MRFFFSITSRRNSKYQFFCNFPTVLHSFSQFFFERPISISIFQRLPDFYHFDLFGGFLLWIGVYWTFFPWIGVFVILCVLANKSNGLFFGGNFVAIIHHIGNIFYYCPSQVILNNQKLVSYCIFTIFPLICLISYNQFCIPAFLKPIHFSDFCTILDPFWIIFGHSLPFLGPFSGPSSTTLWKFWLAVKWLCVANNDENGLKIAQVGLKWAKMAKKQSKMVE